MILEYKVIKFCGRIHKNLKIEKPQQTVMVFDLYLIKYFVLFLKKEPASILLSTRITIINGSKLIFYFRIYFYHQ